MSDAVLSNVETNEVKSMSRVCQIPLKPRVPRMYHVFLLRHAEMACWNLLVASAAAADGAEGLSAAAASGISRAVYSDTSAIVVVVRSYGRGRCLDDGCMSKRMKLCADLGLEICKIRKCDHLESCFVSRGVFICVGNAATWDLRQLVAVGMVERVR